MLQLKKSLEVNFLCSIVGRLASDRPADLKEAFNITEPHNDQRVSCYNYKNHQTVNWLFL